MTAIKDKYDYFGYFEYLDQEASPDFLDYVKQDPHIYDFMHLILTVLDDMSLLKDTSFSMISIKGKSPLISFHVSTQELSTQEFLHEYILQEFLHEFNIVLENLILEYSSDFTQCKEYFRIRQLFRFRVKN
jgi:hypothetical protein